MSVSIINGKNPIMNWPWGVRFPLRLEFIACNIKPFSTLPGQREQKIIFLLCLLDLQITDGPASVSIIRHSVFCSVR